MGRDTRRQGHKNGAVADLKWDAISISSAPPTRIKGHIILMANNDYKFFTRLEGPGRDINAAASAFSQIGFRTTVLTDPNKQQILDAIKTAGAQGEQQFIGAAIGSTLQESRFRGQVAALNPDFAFCVVEMGESANGSSSSAQYCERRE
jgi:hypothetical protein